MMQHLKTEKLIDYMHGALSPQEDAAVYAHIESCDACRKELEAEAALTEMLRTYAAREEREMPATLKAEIWSRIRAAQPSGWTRLREWLRPAVAVPVAAVLALGAYFGTTYLGPHGAPSIEAAYYLQDHEALNSTVPFSDRSSVSPINLDNGNSVDTTQQTAVRVEAASYTAYANQ
jgi:predicted anti-sigma-YlaC factor YlaD